MEYRILKAEEIAEAAALAKNVFMYTIKPSMGQMGLIENVQQYLTADNLARMVEQEALVLWGVWNGHTLYAVAGMQREGHITMLYVIPQLHNRKIGKTLLRIMRKYAYTRYGYEKVTLMALPSYTMRYFQKNGFWVTEQNPGGADYTFMAAKSIREIEYPVRKIPENVLFWIIFGFTVSVTVITAIICGIHLFAGVPV